MTTRLARVRSSFDQEKSHLGVFYLGEPDERGEKACMLESLTNELAVAEQTGDQEKIDTLNAAITRVNEIKTRA